MITSCKLKGFINPFHFLSVFFLFLFSISLYGGPTGQAGDDQVICVPSTNMNAKSSGTGTWSVKVGWGHGTFNDLTDPKTNVTDIGFGINIFIWHYQIPGQPVTDDYVTIYNYSADAGSNVIVCDNSFQMQSPSDISEIPGGATGTWTCNNASVVIDDIHDNHTWVHNLQPGDNKFQWEIIYNDPSLVGGCASSTGQVTITYTGNNLNTYTLSSSSPSYCPGSATIIETNGSELNVDYQLYKDGNPIAGIQSGDGNPLTWSNMTAGNYTLEAISNMYTCTKVMPSSLTITEYPAITDFTITGINAYCTGDPSKGSVTLGGSENNVNYQLLKDGLAYTPAKPGDGNPITWSSLPSGIYTIEAHNTLTNCTKTLSGSLTIVENPLPAVYTLTGTATYCPGTGGPVELGGSENNIEYQLKKNGTDDGIALLGTGSPLTWPNKTTGTYTVEANNPTTTCSVSMNGSAVISSYAALTDYTLSGPTEYCIGSGGVTLTLSGSQFGTNYEYQLVKDNIPVSTQTGTGGSLSWNGLLQGSYWVVATNTTTSCTRKMTGTITVTENPLPVADAGSDKSICYGSSTTLNASGGTGYLWTPGGSTSSSYTVTPTADATYTVQVTDANGCVNTDQVTVTVNPLPTADAGSDAAICAGSSKQLNATGGQTYSWTPATGLSNASISSPVASPANTTTYNVTVTDGNGCQDNDNVIITVMSNPVANAGSDQTICDGDNVSLTASGGTTYNWSTGDNTPIITVAPTSTTNYSVTVTNANGCTDVDEVLVTVSPKPTANAGSDKTICEGTTVSLSASGGDTYLWSNGATSSSINVTPLVTTTYTVSAISLAGCTDDDNVTVTVNPNPTANAGPDQQICIGENATLTATGGGSYLWSPTGDVTTSITVSPAATTDYSVKVTDGNGCFDTDVARVTVNPLPVTGISNLDADYCKDEADFTITGTPTGGTGYFSATTGLTDNLDGTAVFSPSSVPPGTNYNITYNYTDGNGCASSTTQAVYIRNDLSPHPVFDNLDNVYCDADATTHVITATPGDANGVYSGAAAGLTDNNDGSADLIPANLPIGKYTITYTYTDPATSCQGTASKQIDIGIPMQITNLNPTYCEDDAPITLAADQPGGDFSIDGAYSGPQGTAVFDPSTIGTGTHTVTFSLTNSISCSNSSTVNVEVNPLPDASFTLDGVANTSTELKYCDNGPLVTLAGNPNTGGTFSGTGVSGNKFNPAAAGPGTYTISYQYTSSKGCTAIEYATVYVEPAPAVTISGLDAAYCNNITSLEIAGDPLNSGGTTPVAGTWTAPWADPAIFKDELNGKALFDPSQVPTAGTYTITYSVSGANGCSASKSKTVKINFLPTVAFTGLPSEMCLNDAPATLTGSPAGGTFSGPGITGNKFDPSGLATISHNIKYSYIDPATLCTDNSIRSVTVKPLPALYTITGGGTYCEGNGGVHVGLSSSEAGVDYQLNLDGAPLGATVTGTGGAIDFGLQTNEGTYTVTAINPSPNSCSRQMTGSATVAINPLPGDAQPITGNAAVCPSSSEPYSIPVIPDATSYDWTLPSGATISSGAGTNSITVDFSAAAASGTITVKGVNACGNGNAATLDITVKPLPAAAGAITGNATVCLNEQGVIYSVSPVANATSYTWSVPPGATVTSGAGTSQIVVDYTGALSGNVKVTPVNGCGTGTSSSLAVNVVPLPDISTAVPTDKIDCSGNQITLSGSSSTTGATYSWTAENGGHIVSGAGGTNPIVDAAGSYIFEVTEPVNGCASTETVVVTENKAAPQNVSISATHSGIIDCNNPTSTLTATTTSTYPVSYSWTATSGGNIVSGGNSASAIVDAGGSYEVSVKNLNTSCVTKNNITITEDVAQPVVTTVSPEPEKLTCTVSSVTLSGNSSTAGSTLNWTGPAGATITNPGSSTPIVDKAGLYTLTVTGTNGCTATGTVQVSESKTLPDISVLTPASDITCNTSQVTISGSSTTTGATYLWTGPGTITTPGQASTLVDAAGTYTLTVTDPVNGCTDSRNVTVNENKTLPDITFTGTPGVIDCNNPSTTITASTSVASPLYNWTTVNGNIAGGQGTATAVADQAGTYTLTITDQVNGCQTSKNIDVTDDINPPVLTIDPPAVLTCSTTSITLTATSSVAAANLQWTTSDGHIVSGGTSLTPVVNKPGTYTLTATDPANGCSSSKSVLVTQNITAPVISYNASPATLTCSQTTVTLSGTAAGATLMWTGPAGATITNPGSNFPVVNMAGVYTLTATSTNGCTSTQAITVTENKDLPQNINIAPDPASELNCNNPQVNLLASSTTAGVSYTWTATAVGNIVSGNGTDQISVDAPADYTVIVKEPVSQCTDSKTITVTKNTTVPVITLPSVPDPITCTNTTSTVEASADPAFDFQWSGPGNITDPTVSHHDS